MYTPFQRGLQEEFGTVRLADRIQERLVAEELDPSDVALIEGCSMFFIATVDSEGRPNCSYKGGAPGFVRVVDTRTLAFPWYDGNGMFLTAGNMGDTGLVGLLFVDFQKPNRLRVNGSASIHRDDPLISAYPEAQFVIRVRINEVFPNCSRYIHRMVLEESSPYVPEAGKRTPKAGWKEEDWAKDVVG